MEGGQKQEGGMDGGCSIGSRLFLGVFFFFCLYVYIKCFSCL